MKIVGACHACRNPLSNYFTSNTTLIRLIRLIRLIQSYPLFSYQVPLEVLFGKGNLHDMMEARWRGLTTEWKLSSQRSLGSCWGSQCNGRDGYSAGIKMWAAQTRLSRSSGIVIDSNHVWVLCNPSHRTHTVTSYYIYIYVILFISTNLPVYIYIHVTYI